MFSTLHRLSKQTKWTVAVSLMFFWPTLIAAQERQVLVPFNVRHPDPQPGANGSLWTTDLTIYNSAGEGMVTIPELILTCGFPTCPAEYRLAPGQTAKPQTYGVNFYPGPLVLTLQGEAADSVVARLRVQDVSREHLTHGVEIPVIDVADAPRGRVDFLDLPHAGESFRSALRIFGLAQPMQPQSFRLEVWDTDLPGATGNIDELLHSSRIDVPPGTAMLTPSGKLLWVPGNVFIDIRSLGMDSSASVRIQVESVGKLPFYALVTTTHNETQHVTVATPVEVP